jgi:hypothetical protein
LTTPAAIANATAIAQCLPSCVSHLSMKMQTLYKLCFDLIETTENTVKRVEQLLEELGEPLEMIEEVQSLKIRRIGCMNPCP